MIGGARVHREALLDLQHVQELPLHLLREAQALLGAVVPALVAEGREDYVVEDKIVAVEIVHGG